MYATSSLSYPEKLSNDSILLVIKMRYNIYIREITFKLNKIRPYFKNHENFFESLPLVLSDFTSIVNQRFFSTTNTNSTTTTSNSTSTSTTATTSRVMDRSHQCPFCLFKSQYKHVIVRHIKFKHTGERPHGCPMCNSRFVSASDLQRHLYTHTGENTFSCLYCSRKFKNKSSLKIHVSIYKTKIFQSNMSPLNSQLASDFASSSQECVGEYSTSDQSSNQESLTYLGTNFQCSMCSYNCSSVKELRQHIRFYHMDSKSYSCPFCNKVFITKQHIQRHILIHTGEKPYTCPRCLKGFRVKHHLTNHLNKKMQCILDSSVLMPDPNLNSMPMPFSSTNDPLNNPVRGSRSSFQGITTCRGVTFHCCLLCGYKNTSHINTRKKSLSFVLSAQRVLLLKENLIRHFVVHSEDKPFKCSACSASFKYRYSLKKHRTIMENLQAQVSESDDDVLLQITHKLVKSKQEYQCSYCPFKDYLKVNVQRHTMLNHTRKKPFSCD
ncbi:Zinc finger protein, partial [Armadillidium nasatum]